MRQEIADILSLAGVGPVGQRTCILQLVVAGSRKIMWPFGVVGNNIMKYRKTPNILVILFLVVGVFANSALADMCFCGEACLHGLQRNAEIKANFLFHMRCSGIPCKSCQLEKGQTLKAANSRHQPPYAKILDNAPVLSAFLGSPPAFLILKNPRSPANRGAIASLPVYLQNLSILC